MKKEFKNKYKKIRLSRTEIIDEHRFIMENHIGRKLYRFEIVHHINGIKDDNRIENLEIIKLSEHSKNHMNNGDIHKLTKEEMNLGILVSARKSKERAISRRFKNGKYMCIMCKEFKEKENFGKNKSKLFGLDNRCKKCKKLQDKKRISKLIL